MAKEFIVAIELGSSKVTGIAGKKNLDGSISVLAVVQEKSSSYIRRGVVYNIDKTMLALINIKKRLETLLHTKIKQVYVGVGGQSIIGVKNVIMKDLPPETIVTQEMVNEIMDANRDMDYPDKEILDAITLEYKVDSQMQVDPVGIQCSRLEGNFLNILWRKTFYRSLNKCFDEAGISIAEMYLAPLALADSVLAEAERRSGCVLVDLGADTTTVSVYYKNVLRHLAVIPLGGANITRDIATLQMEEQDAEKMKLKYGSAYTDFSDVDSAEALPIDNERTVERRKFVDIVESRLEEIVENVWFQVPSEFYGRLLGGIILTGGGANMPNIEKAFRNHTRVDKIRVAKTVMQTIDATQPEVTAHDGRMNTVIGLLAKGDMNCAGDDINTDLFNSGDNANEEGSAELPRQSRSQNELQGKGIVQTEAEKLRLEAEERRKREEEEEAKRLEEKQKEEEERRKKRENSFLHKTLKMFKKFANDAISDEE
jgi:cell division protein FtsA